MQKNLAPSLDIGLCFSDSFRVWSRYFLLFSLASIVTAVASIASFTVLMGSLYAGLLGMLLRAMRNENPAFRDLFRFVRRFIPFFITIWFGIILTIAGTVLLIVPGLFFGTSCFYLMILVMERGIHFDESFVKSRKAVMRYGFRRHLLLGLIALGIPIATIWTARHVASQGVENLALIVPVILQPFALGLIVSAYRQTLEIEARQKREYEKEYDFMRNELETAHDMQMELLPKSSPIIEGYSLAGICIPANHVGGDYFAYRRLDMSQNKLAIVIADVSGKAMSAAITAVRFNEMLRYELESRTSPADILHGLQRSLIGQIDRETFITCCIGIFDTAGNSVEIANAGHCLPYHYRSRSRTVELMDITGYALGLPFSLVLEESYRTVRIEVEPENAVVLFSDGVTDAQNAAGEFFGEKRFEELLGRSLDQDAETAIESITRAIKDFAEGVPYGDDLSIIVLKRHSQ